MLTTTSTDCPFVSITTTATNKHDTAKMQQYIKNAPEYPMVACRGPTVAVTTNAPSQLQHVAIEQTSPRTSVGSISATKSQGMGPTPTPYAQTKLMEPITAPYGGSIPFKDAAKMQQEIDMNAQEKSNKLRRPTTSTSRVANAVMNSMMNIVRTPASSTHEIPAAVRIGFK
jgi:hypothetical protein